MKEERRLREGRLRYRAWRRGMREMDLLLGGYADRALGSMDEAGLRLFETLLDYPDSVIYEWVRGGGDLPEDLEEIVEELKRGMR